MRFFPLAQWIEDHHDAPHNLSRSGMRGALRSVPRLLRGFPPATEDDLRNALARRNGVPPDRLFLTHGASEGNALATTFLAGHIRGKSGRAPKFWAPTPEYPPLFDLAPTVGFRRVAERESADLVVVSDPNNPTGEPSPVWAEAAPASSRVSVLVDETFRDFSRVPRRGPGEGPGLWRTGTFTKVYGGDDVRVGYVIAPEPALRDFAQFHSLALDRIAPWSIGAAMAIHRHREEVLRESRGIFQANLRELREQVDDVPRLAAPLWFDRVPDGDAVERRAIRNGILVCSGSYFGDRRGVRICLTRRSFPRDLAAYLAVRERASPP
ncbi:MAG: aminotransferase class I/II-fold pyridoxal phosphate-dependent enzyme [Thermoplasmata archaeon]|nr:aminotransferase class I/II-fold pyridoxal phosphate-dependent enzyme [Thermoplasmata archaeon]